MQWCQPWGSIGVEQRRSCTWQVGLAAALFRWNFEMVSGSIGQTRLGVVGGSPDVRMLWFVELDAFGKARVAECFRRGDSHRVPDWRMLANPPDRTVPNRHHRAAIRSKRR